MPPAMPEGAIDGDTPSVEDIQQPLADPVSDEESDGCGSQTPLASEEDGQDHVGQEVFAVEHPRDLDDPAVDRGAGVGPLEAADPTVPVAESSSPHDSAPVDATVRRDGGTLGLQPYHPHCVSGLFPWDPRRWPDTPVPRERRVLPTVGIEGNDVLIAHELAEDSTMRYPDGTPYEGAMHRGPGGVRMRMGVHWRSISV